MKSISVLKTNKKIKDIIQNHYHHEDQSLHLWSHEFYWVEVLNYKNWKMLRYLELSYCNINNTQVKNISNIKWVNLQRLNLYGNNISQKGIKILLQNQWPKLQQLYIGDNKIKISGFELIEKKINKLVNLSVKLNFIDFGCLRKNVSGNFINLVSLDLSQNQIGSQGITMLIRLNLPKLAKLWISQSKIDNNAVRYLVKIQWENLQSLDLSFNQIGFDGYLALYQGFWNNLQTIRIDGRSAISVLQMPVSRSPSISTKTKLEIFFPFFFNKEMQEQLEEIVS